jgi:hypothetical protein
MTAGINQKINHKGQIMKLDSDISFNATFAGSGDIMKGKFKNLEYSEAGSKGDVDLPKTITLPGTISVDGIFEPGLRTVDLNHGFVLLEGDATLFTSVLHGKLEFEKALPANVHEIVIKINDNISPGGSEAPLIKVTEDEIKGVADKRSIHTLQSKKKPGSGINIAQSHKKPGSGSDVAI